MALSPVMVELRATTGEFMAKLGEARAEVAKLSTEGAAHFEKIKAVGAAALLGVAGAGLAIGTMAVKAAVEGEQAHARLAQAIKNTGGSMEELEPKVNALSDRFAKFGYTNDEVEAALAQMTTSLHNPEKALGAMGLAADLAKFKNISLSDASLTVAKALEGQVRPLKQLGIDLPVAAGGAQQLTVAQRAMRDAQQHYNMVLAQYGNVTGPKAAAAHRAIETAQITLRAAQERLSDAQTSSQKITEALSRAVGGQASTAAETYTGKMEALRAQTENLTEKLGNALIPVIQQVIGVTTTVIDWLEKHRTTAEALGVVIGGSLVVAITAYVGSLVIATATTVASAAAMTAGTVRMGVRIAAVYAEQAAGAVASAATQVASWVAVAAAATAAFIAENAASLGIITAVVAIAAAAYELYKHWGQVWGFIKEATSAAVGFVKDHLGWIALALGPIGIAAFELYKHWDSVWSGIKTVISDVWSFIKPIIDGIESAVSGVSDAIGKLSSAAGAVKSVGSAVGGALSHIPGFASGTSYAPGGLALVGEDGPELVRLPRGSAVTPSAQTAQALGTDMSGVEDLLGQVLEAIKAQPREQQRLARTA